MFGVVSFCFELGFHFFIWLLATETVVKLKEKNVKKLKQKKGR
jgi:16S rRNA U1498 N3-methylase RsmE